VQCITVADLFQSCCAPRSDIIVVDAEGFDHVILSQFDFARLSTRLVIYETESMDAAHAARWRASWIRADSPFSKRDRIRSPCGVIPKRFENCPIGRLG